MWKVLFHVKADQPKWESSHCIEQVLQPLLRASSRIQPTAQVHVQCARAEKGYYELQTRATGERAWVKTAEYWEGIRRFRLDKAGSLAQITSMRAVREQDMASPEAIAEFVAEALDDGPADTPTALILWGHGGSWRVYLMGKDLLRWISGSGPAPTWLVHAPLPVQGPDRFRELFGRGSATEAQFARLLEEQLERPSRLQGLPSLRRGLDKALRGRPRQKLGVLGFNSCFMACVETAYEINDHVEFMVASQEETPFEGWRHEEWLTKLSPSMDAEALARLWVRSYDAGSRPKCTISAIRLGPGITTLADKIRRFVEAAVKLPAADVRSIQAARKAVAEYGRYGGRNDVLMVDIVQVFEEIAARCLPLREAAGLVAAACRHVVLESAAGAERKHNYGSHGLSIFFPSSRAEFERLAEKDRYDGRSEDGPAFAAFSRWRDFLEHCWQ